MKYTVEVIERVNVGNFEYIEYKAGTEFTAEDAAEADLTPAEFGKQELDALLLSHRRRAYSLTPEGSESFILDHPALKEK